MGAGGPGSIPGEALFVKGNKKKGKEREGRKEGKGRALLAQSVERAAFNRKVVGSRPTGGVFFQSSRKRTRHMTGRKKSQREQEGA